MGSGGSADHASPQVIETEDSDQRHGRHTPKDDIPGFSRALWYSFAIISTIGFGDVAAVSVLGRILSAIMGICGLVVVSAVMSIVVNFYSEAKDLDD